MNNTIGQIITDLRKKAGVTQDELASALHISSQAVSKWETNTCFPDTQMLPLIADYFKVSIDYLFKGNDVVYDDIYAKVQQRTASYPQMSKEAYEEAHRLFAAAHHGISHGNLRGKELMYDEPSHISDFNGLSLLSGKGYGAIVTRAFFENVTQETMSFAQPIFEMLSKPDVLQIVAAVISMSDISLAELREKLRIDEEKLEQALSIGVSKGIIIEKVSKHKSLGKTYEIESMYHTCICILLATMEMQRYSLDGLTRCTGFGDYPISLTDNRKRD